MCVVQILVLGVYFYVVYNMHIIIYQNITNSIIYVVMSISKDTMMRRAIHDVQE